MARTAILLIVGALIGAGLTFAAMRIASSPDWQSGTLSGPVAIYLPGAEKHGYLGVDFSNERGRSLYVAQVSSLASAAPSHLLAGDRVNSVNTRSPHLRNFKLC